MVLMRSLPRFIRLASLSFFGVAILMGMSTSLIHAASYSVTITDTAFVPASFSVMTGDSIEFRNSSTATQSAKSTLATGFNTGDIGPSQTKTVTVNTAGTFTYSSAYNAALTGTMQVTSASSSTTTTTTSTSSATKGQPTQTQEQPVSGVFEVVVGMVLTGTFLVGSGLVWQRRLAYNDTHENERSQVTSLPIITWTRDQEPPRA
jgi:plastocyanin